jgi:hypothetical protein
MTSEIDIVTGLWDGITDETELFVPIQDAPNKKNAVRAFYGDIYKNIIRIPAFLDKAECDRFCIKISSGPNKKLKTYKTTYFQLCNSMDRVSRHYSEKHLECWLTGMTMIGKVIRVQQIWSEFIQ